MISNFPSSDNSFFENPFPSFDLSELFPAETGTQSPETGSDHSGSDGPVQSGSSYEPGSIESNRAVLCVEERKRRRMISNRESARRSRMRKQNHIENLRNEANRFRAENRELTNRVRFASFHLTRVRIDNSRLRSEYVALRDRLNDIRQLLVFQQFTVLDNSTWPCTSVVSGQTTSLMT